jgi:aminopeptidase N
MNQYRDFNDFMSNIYGGGAVFLRRLSELIGDEALIAGMRVYVGIVYLGIGTPEQFYSAVQAQTDVDLGPIFCEQVGIMCR